MGGGGGAPDLKTVALRTLRLARTRYTLRIHAAHTHATTHITSHTPRMINAYLFMTIGI